jgi:hypothetical protein
MGKIHQPVLKVMRKKPVATDKNVDFSSQFLDLIPFAIPFSKSNKVFIN